MHPLLPALLLALTAVLAVPALAQSTSGRAPAAATATGGVAWADLNTEQQTALQPLETLWPKLPAEHQRKWLALVQKLRLFPNVRQLPAALIGHALPRLLRWQSRTQLQQFN